MRAWRHGGIIAAVILLSAAVFSLSACNDKTPDSPEVEQTSFLVPPTIALPGRETTQVPETSTTAKASETDTTIPKNTNTEPPPSSTSITTTRESISTTTNPTTTKPIKTTKPIELPQNLKSIAGIVEYFNKAANNAKSNAKRATQTLHSIDVKESSFADNDLTSTVALGRNKNDKKNRYVSLKNLPVPGESYASRLDPKGVASAVCGISGNDYLITIKLKPESGKIYQDNSYHGQVFWLSGSEGEADFYDLLQEFISGFEGEGYLVNILKSLLSAPEALRINYSYSYSKASITCRVNQKTGRLQSISYKIHQKVNGKSLNTSIITYEVDEAKAYSFTW